MTWAVGREGGGGIGLGWEEIGLSLDGVGGRGGWYDGFLEKGEDRLGLVDVVCGCGWVV